MFANLISRMYNCASSSYIGHRFVTVVLFTILTCTMDVLSNCINKMFYRFHLNTWIKGKDNGKILKKSRNFFGIFWKICFKNIVWKFQKEIRKIIWLTTFIVERRRSTPNRYTRYLRRDFCSRPLLFITYFLNFLDSFHWGPVGNRWLTFQCFFSRFSAFFFFFFFFFFLQVII